MTVRCAGAARAALDLALWDFDAKRGASAVWQIAGIDSPRRLVTAWRLATAAPEAMAAAALEERHRPLLRLLLPDPALAGLQVAAVRAALPRVRLIIDAGHGWGAAGLAALAPGLVAADVDLVLNPALVGSPPGSPDDPPIEVPRGLLLGTGIDTRAGLETLAPAYGAIAIGPDRAGGLTEALALVEDARERGLKLLVGNGPSSALGAAPAVILGQEADWLDLDTPLLLARDRQPGLRYDGSLVYPPSTSLWG